MFLQWLVSVSFAPGSVLAPGADLTGKYFVSWIAACAAVALVVSDHSLSCVPENQAVAALDLARTCGLDDLANVAFGYITKYYRVSQSPFNIQFKHS